MAKSRLPGDRAVCTQPRIRFTSGHGSARGGFSNARTRGPITQHARSRCRRPVLRRKRKNDLRQPQVVATRAAPLALQTHRDRRWLSCSRTCRVSAAVTEMPRPPLNRAEEFPQLLRGGSAGIRNTPSEGATSGLARASGSTPGLALRDGPRQTPRRGEHFLQSDECRRISALSFWALYTSRQTDAPLAKSVLLADRCCAGRSKHKSVYSTPGTFLLSPQRCHRSAKDAQLPFHVCAIANVVGSHLQRRCIHSNRLSVLSGVSYHLDPSGLGPSVTTPDKSHHQIMTPTGRMHHLRTAHAIIRGVAVCLEKSFEVAEEV